MAHLEAEGVGRMASTKAIDFSKALDKSKLRDKSVLVTGGASGIGLASAIAFAEAGAYVTIADINTEAGQEAARKLTDQGFYAQFIATDATSWASQTTAFKSAIAFAPSKSIDIVLPSAGVTGQDMRRWLDAAATAGGDPEPPKTAALDINLTGVYYTAHLALYYFRQTAPSAASAHGDKHLLLVSSLAGYVGITGSGEYNASKFGVRGLWKGLRQFHPFGDNHSARFRTNLIAPTFIQTNMTAGAGPSLTQAGIRMGTVGDVVAAIVRACCDEDVRGRAIAIAAGEEAEGDRNFDLCDDLEEHDGGRILLERIQAGVLGNVQILGAGDGARRRKG